MKRNFFLSHKARRDLFSIACYIENDSPQAAGRFLEVFEYACDRISSLPEMGSVTNAFLHRSELKNARMLPIKNFRKYLIFYRTIAEGKIEIIRVIHGARDIPSLFNPS